MILLIIILFMEEVIGKFTRFLNCIFEAQNQADALKLQLMLKPGSKVKLFTRIDKACKGEITSSDIVAFCDGAIPVNMQTTQIIGRYFKNWQQGITFNQFFDVLKPRKTSVDKETPHSQNQGVVLIKLIKTIISNFYELQSLRKQLSNDYLKIQKYFSQYYGSNSTITKEQLKMFMARDSTYSEQKYEQVAHYIYGSLQCQIPWQTFFDVEAIKQTQVIIDRQIKEDKKIQNNRQQQEISPSLMGNQHLHDVLLQIQQIQKCIKAKRVSKAEAHVHTTRNSSRENERKNLVGKVIRRSIPEPQFQNITSPYKFRKQIFQSFQTKELNEIGPKYLKKYQSEAQLKIKEIQRRAMNKCLSNQTSMSKPKYFQSPSYCPVSFDINNLSQKQPRFNLNHRNQIYSTLDSPLNNQGVYFWRPVSPRLLRY